MSYGESASYGNAGFSTLGMDTLFSHYRGALFRWMLDKSVAGMERGCLFGETGKHGSAMEGTAEVPVVNPGMETVVRFLSVGKYGALRGRRNVIDIGGYRCFVLVAEG